MDSPLAFELPALLLGLLFGSFLNVCISRLPRHESISTPRSHCPHCNTPIRWYDNIPLLSWLLLRARCRTCKQPISWRYPAVELTLGLWFLFVALRFIGAMRNFAAWRIESNVRPDMWAQVSIDLISLAILGFLLIGLLVMDWQTHTLPDAFTLTGTLIGFVLTCCQAVFLPAGALDINVDTQRQLRLRSPGSFVAKGTLFMTGPEHLVLGRVLAILSAAGLILLIRWLYRRLRHREGLGLGDAKLMAMLAAFLGFWPAMLALFLGIIGCAAYALILLARRKATPTTQLPLGSFLALGGLISALIGAPLIAWYSSLL